MASNMPTLKRCLASNVPILYHLTFNSIWPLTCYPVWPLPKVPVKKEDGGYHPCIDYWELNKVTMKNRHPLPLLSIALGSLFRTTIFMKLGLHSPYSLVHIQEGEKLKTA